MTGANKTIANHGLLQAAAAVETRACGPFPGVIEGRWRLEQESVSFQFDADMPALDDGMISVALSPVQLAAILETISVSDGETRSNRLWGVLGFVGGTLELLGSAALLVDPDPTISKAVGVVGLVHGSDVVTTNWEQIRTGQS